MRRIQRGHPVGTSMTGIHRQNPLNCSLSSLNCYCDFRHNVTILVTNIAKQWSVRLTTLRSATSGWDEMDLASNDGHGEDYQGCADCCACAKAV